MKQARLDALENLENEGALTARELAERTGKTRTACAMLLLRARRHGLVVHSRRSGLYGLSDRGIARLAWLRGAAE